jgi:deoxyribose-phosphate aldolase
MHRAKGLCGLCPSLLGKKGGRTGGRGLVVCAVVSFPFGMDTKEQKLSQCLESLERGAKELDIFMNFLTQEETKPAVELIAKSGMEFVKTSTGFSFASATEEDVKLLCSV